MKKQNVIDLTAYREEQQRKSAYEPGSPAEPMMISEELITAIQVLIQRLRRQEAPEK